jgi:hypothetical protein
LFPFYFFFLKEKKNCLLYSIPTHFHFLIPSFILLLKAKNFSRLHPPRGLQIPKTPDARDYEVAADYLDYHAPRHTHHRSHLHHEQHHGEQGQAQHAPSPAPITT